MKEREDMKHNCEEIPKHIEIVQLLSHDWYIEYLYQGQHDGPIDFCPYCGIELGTIND